jgi:hypothetical protein
MVHEDERDHRHLEGHPEGPEGEDVGRDRVAASPKVVAVVDEHCDGEQGRGDAEKTIIPVPYH